MTGQGNERPSGLLSWLRGIFGPRGPRRSTRDLDAETLQVQIDIIRSAFDEEVGVHYGDHGEFLYLYHPSRALVRSEHLVEVDTYVRDSGNFDGEGTSVELIDGLVLYEFPPRARDDGDVLVTLAELDARNGRSIASPDHILHVVGQPGKACPATEPLPPTSGDPVPAVSKNATLGRGIRVSVVDTGWHSPAAQDGHTTWLATGVEGDEEQLATVGTDRIIHEYAGHGTFVAGVLKCIAPATDIEIEGFLTQGGAIWESAITRELNQAMTDYEDDPTTRRFDPQLPDLISISAGTHTRNDEGLLGFEMLARLYRWAEDGGPLVVAAAGNEGRDLPFYPAAFDWVVGVGSLDRDGRRSDFSNFGDWVDVYAHGRDLVNAFPTGTYTYVEPASGKLCGTTQTFTSIARWSGTSFATPIVSGLIAAYMSEHKGTSARQARDALIAAAPTIQDGKVGTLKALGPPFVP